jgi:small conductance mechanosensitive channel
VALLTLIIGLWVIRLLLRTFRKVLRLRDVDPTLQPFLSSIVSVILKVLLLLTVASMTGIETTSFVAALGAAGLAIGLALQGSLSNFAGGVLILLFKPFRVGDFIQAQGGEGSVTEINILYTTLVTADHKKVVIPNGVLSNNMITNFSALETRRLDLFYPLAYGNDASQALQMVRAIVGSEVRILKEPVPIVAIDEVIESGSMIIVLVWVKRTEYGDVKFHLNEAVIESFRKAGFSGVLPHMSGKG